ncbi:MAG: hypothetical protein GX366_07480 [Epulopiscium sp.]|nr:hypothetical protein [Candidatus Epulonipiscium sp.]
MKQIVINTYSYRHHIQEYIEGRINKLAREEYFPNISVEETGSVVFVICEFPQQMSQAKQEKYFQEYLIIPLARAMVDIIQNEFTKEYANKIMETRYNFTGIKIMGLAPNKKQAENLLDPITQELAKENSFCLDGWIRFRLADYRAYIVRMVDDLIYEYYEYKEYEEFIRLLKEFVIDQTPLEEVVHFVTGFKGTMNLYNKNAKKIMSISEDESNDFILGTLLTIAPRKIIVHRVEGCNNINAISTIRRVYGDRVSFCKACEICNRPKWYKKIVNKIRPPTK